MYTVIKSVELVLYNIGFYTKHSALSMAVDLLCQFKTLNYLPLRDVEMILQAYFLNPLYKLVSWAVPLKLDSCPVSPNSIDDKSTLVQVMAWCRQTTNNTSTLVKIMAWRCSFQWRHNERDGALNHQCRDGLLDRLFRRRSKNTSRLRVTGLCEGIPLTKGQ